jgi:4-hydroxybenzoate polyprenyltransferase
MKRAVGLARLLRIPGIGALGTPALIGALTLSIFDLPSLAILFVIGALAGIFGFILNDFVDAELDRLVPELQEKPLVSGVIQRKTAVFICALCAFFAFFLLMILYRGQTVTDFKIFAALSLLLAGVLGSIYDLYGKKLPGSDLLVSISMAFLVLVGAYSFGAPIALTWIVFILTFNQSLHMNAVEGGIKDADHDYKMGVINLAYLSGVRVEGDKLTIPWSFKIFGLAIRFTSAFLLFTPALFFGYHYEIWTLLLLVFATAVVLFFSIRLVMMTRFDRDRIRKYIGLQSFLRYSLVPIMLVPLIGPLGMLILIVFPIAWYIIFTPLVKEKLFKPRM